MKLTRKQVLNVHVVLNKLKGVTAAAKFHYLCILNIKELEKEVIPLREAFKLPSDYEEFESLRREILLSFASKDSNDNIIWQIENILPTYTAENKLRAEKQLAELTDKYKSAIDNFNKFNEEFEEFLNESVELNLVEINIDLVPETTGENIEILHILLKT